jgi:hypothetical protein
MGRGNPVGLLALLALLAVAGNASAASQITLHLDPAASSIAPAAGAPESLTGSLTLEIGELPVSGATTLELVDLALLAVTSIGDVGIALDPDSLSPGLFVLQASGHFEVATALFLRLDWDASDFGLVFDLAIPDLVGELNFGTGGASVERLTTSFDIDAGGPVGVLTVTLVAVPEPAAALLLGLGLAALAGRSGRRSLR